jgi:hypothetical protein
MVADRPDDPATARRIAVQHCTDLDRAWRCLAQLRGGTSARPAAGAGGNAVTGYVTLGWRARLLVERKRRSRQLRLDLDHPGAGRPAAGAGRVARQGGAG